MSQGWNVPQHVAIIMDGNSKWARSRLLSKTIGHRKGLYAVQKIVEIAKKIGVRFLTLYAFSIENWNRPSEEVEYLMSLFRSYLQRDVKRLIQNDVKIMFIGNRAMLSDDIQVMMKDAEHESINNTFTLIIAISYSGRDDIRRAAMMFAESIALNKDGHGPFESFLSTANVPDPDLLIRTGGEMRISNFLLWEISYTELYFTTVLWPDFKSEDFMDAIRVYSSRERRYGGRRDGTN
ncbi:di-trans,poly-cis-decaprenylcistransferase [Rickettsiales endosymbiont of Peranema trichophorum]|uniref:polyprenyl diphosphate synthase n=1 Tax=Rickettsiales endosymbiont of Peranema trichophorum TaxID=2486577 RepID=UPI001022A239|nr:polyprenyl diphosphate synthase [Rickettsiales endosymbiont of Peranema trichophorum]RZI47544.1 di-trans,poly-cis-decaprenylcistransferase [Rickettsiales endosymbiont of Peranema trichophorum]